MNLVQESLRRILAGQHPSGGLVAATDFPTYNYCWLRDGTFTAYALDRWGHHAAAGRFHAWVAQRITERAAAIADLARRAQGGEVLAAAEFPPARYRLDGAAAADDWPNLQLDGYGAWLWGLAEHARLSGDPGVWSRHHEAVHACCLYLTTFWNHPCFDCWEENGDRVHPSTLACLYGGLRAAAAGIGASAATETAERIREAVLRDGVRDGHLVKYLGSREIDASLLGVAVPFGVLDPKDPIALRTLAEIRERLVDRGGVRRYEGDTYYGGGRWLLLTAWFGWYLARSGQREHARRCLEWVEAQATPEGGLPEQVGGEERDPGKHGEWVQRWGMPSRSLLWSHAMYLVLAAELGVAAES